MRDFQGETGVEGANQIRTGVSGLANDLQGKHRTADADRLTVTFHPSLPEHGQRLMAALDVNVVFDERAPRRCNCPGCKAYRRAETQQRMARHVRQLVRAGVCPMHRGPQPCAQCEREQVEP